MIVLCLKSQQGEWVPVLLHPSTERWERRNIEWLYLPPASLPPCSCSSPSLVSYLCLFLGRWHPVPATRCTLVASLSEPSSIHSKRGRSCKRQQHELISRDWALRYSKACAKPQPVNNAPLKEFTSYSYSQSPVWRNKWSFSSWSGLVFFLCGPS